MDQLGQRPPRQHAHAPLRRPAAPNDAISPPPTPDPSNIGLGQRHTFPVSGPYKHLPLSHSDPDDDFFGDGRARTSLAAVGRHERPSTPRAEGPAHGDGAESLRGTPKRQGSHPIRPYVDHEVDVGGPQSHSRAHIRTYAEDQRVQAYPRLSKPVELMRGSYDCVVVGSGYGGAIAASRMARTESQTVCVLECGREKWPGEYPVGMFEAAKELRVSGDLEVAPGILPGKMVDGGNPTGMYHLIMGKGQNAVVCNGMPPSLPLTIHGHMAGLQT